MARRKKKNKINKLIPGNRCGHDPKNPRFSDRTRRGKGGQPLLVGIVSGLFRQSYDDRAILTTWQEMNQSGRRRRGEIRETNTSVGQYLTAQWWRMETNRLAAPDTAHGFLEVPDSNFIANIISSESDDWGEHGVSTGRIETLLAEWGRCGYITSKVQAFTDDGGVVRRGPNVRTFTKKFFIELAGGIWLWEKIRAAGAIKIKNIKEKCIDEGVRTFRKELTPGRAVKPAHAKIIKKSGWPQWLLNWEAVPRTKPPPAPSF